jgi:hypothetical protein
MNMFKNWKILLALSIVFLLIVLFTSIASGLWVILSLGVGFLFGFAIQKGDLCGASAMSEVILMRDSRKLFGLWIAILSSMIGFAILHSLGIIELAPKKLIWLSALVGGFIFGIGTVFGGGCVSGCLYKGASGNINSIAALLTMPIGISLVEYGPLQSFSETLKTYVVNNSDGSPVTLHSILGLPYWVAVTIIALITIVLIFLKSKKKQKKSSNKFEFANIFRKSWKPWQAGIAIGIIGVMAWLSSLPIGRNYPLGVTHGVNHVYQVIIDDNVKYAYKKPSAKKTTIQEINKEQKTPIEKTEIKPIEPKKVSIWLMLLVIGFTIGAYVSAKMSGQAKLLPKEPSQTIIAMFGGLLIGAGAAIGTGCVIGNIISGWGMLSVGMFIFGITTLLGNWITTYFYLMGGKIISKN